MKILILLSLAAICLAKHLNGRSAFFFPGGPTDHHSRTLVWDEFADTGSLNPERARRESNKVSSEEPVVLHNPNRKDVKIGHFPAHGFHAAPEEAKKNNDIIEAPGNALSVISNLPIIKQEEPLFTENPLPVLEKEKASSSESSSSDQSSESAASNNQEEPSSSEENVSPAAKQEESSSSEESSAPAANQVVPLVNEESSEPSNNEAESPSSDNNNPETPSSDSTSENEEDAPAKVDAKKQDLAKKPGLQPFVVANSPSFSANALRNLFFNVRDVDGLLPAASKKAKGSVLRPVRGVKFTFSDLKLNNARNNLQEPQGQIKRANIQRRWKRPVKK